MSTETYEVPVVILPDGREFIADETCLNVPAVLAFVARFSNYWTYDVNRCGFVGPVREEGR